MDSALTAINRLRLLDCRPTLQLYAASHARQNTNRNRYPVYKIIQFCLRHLCGFPLRNHSALSTHLFIVAVSSYFKLNDFHSPLQVEVEAITYEKPDIIIDYAG